MSLVEAPVLDHREGGEAGLGEGCRSSYSSSTTFSLTMSRVVTALASREVKATVGLGEGRCGGRVVVEVWVESITDGLLPHLQIAQCSA